MKKRILTGFLAVAVLLLAIIMVGYLRMITNPKMMHLQELQAQTQESFQKYADTVNTAGQEIKISSLTPFEWDYVFYAGYYMKGLESIEEAIKAKKLYFDLSTYTVFDEHFGDDEEGLVFINKKEEYIVTVPLSQILGSKSIWFETMNESCLKSHFGPHSNKFFIFIKCNQGE